MKIMFICTGNICRSAMAHWLLKKKTEDLGREDIEVYSCGVHAQNGDIPTYEAKKVMKDEYDVDMQEHKATNIKDPWGYDIETYRFCASEIEECINKITCEGL